MCLTKSLLVIVVVLGALEIWSVEGMTTSRFVRPTKMVHHEGEKEHLPQHYHHEHATVKPAYDPPHYQSSITSPLVYPQQQPAQTNTYQWQPQSQNLPPTPRPTVVDQYDNRYKDGSYEFRYELSDGTVRYECGYFIWFNQQRVLVVKGYYSYHLPDHWFYTVFYTADQNGYRQDSASYSVQPPVLPISLSADLVHEDGLRNFVDSDVNSTDDGHVSK